MPRTRSGKEPLFPFIPEIEAIARHLSGLKTRQRAVATDFMSVIEADLSTSAEASMDNNQQPLMDNPFGHNAGAHGNQNEGEQAGNQPVNLQVYQAMMQQLAHYQALAAQANANANANVNAHGNANQGNWANAFINNQNNLGNAHGGERTLMDDAMPRAGIGHLAIRLPPIEANNFDIKPQVFNLIGRLSLHFVCAMNVILLLCMMAHCR